MYTEMEGYKREMNQLINKFRKDIEKELLIKILELSRKTDYEIVKGEKRITDQYINIKDIQMLLVNN